MPRTRVRGTLARKFLRVRIEIFDTLSASLFEFVRRLRTAHVHALASDKPEKTDQNHVRKYE